MAMREPKPTQRVERVARDAADHKAAARAVRELLAKLQRLIDRNMRL